MKNILYRNLNMHSKYVFYMLRCLTSSATQLPSGTIVTTVGTSNLIYHVQADSRCRQRRQSRFSHIKCCLSLCFPLLSRWFKTFLKLLEKLKFFIHIRYSFFWQAFPVILLWQRPMEAQMNSLGECWVKKQYTSRHRICGFISLSHIVENHPKGIRQ